METIGNLIGLDYNGIFGAGTISILSFISLIGLGIGSGTR